MPGFAGTVYPLMLLGHGGSGKGVGKIVQDSEFLYLEPLEDQDC